MNITQYVEANFTTTEKDLYLCFLEKLTSEEELPILSLNLKAPTKGLLTQFQKTVTETLIAHGMTSTEETTAFVEGKVGYIPTANKSLDWAKVIELRNPNKSPLTKALSWLIKETGLDLKVVNSMMGTNIPFSMKKEAEKALTAAVLVTMK